MPVVVLEVVLLLLLPDAFIQGRMALTNTTNCSRMPDARADPAAALTLLRCMQLHHPRTV
jgi:hypothetical protein